MAQAGLRPGFWQSVLELRAGLEGLSLMATLPWLKRRYSGAGEPVMVLPGLSTSDNSTYFLRQFLSDIGYQVHGWEQGVNHGLRDDTLAALEQRLAVIAEQSGQAVAVIGWNVGGMYARALANQNPELVSQVITLATPFAMPSMSGLSQALGRLYRHYNRDGTVQMLQAHSDAWEVTPKVPSTSVLSESDGVTNWRYCLDSSGPRTENVRVPGSHTGMTVNPWAYFVIADRLDERPESWHRFADKYRGVPFIHALVGSVESART